MTDEQIHCRHCGHDFTIVQKAHAGIEPFFHCDKCKKQKIWIRQILGQWICYDCYPVYPSYERMQRHIQGDSEEYDLVRCPRCLSARNNLYPESEGNLEERMA